MPHPDFCIAGAGIIGLSLALELNRRGAAVVVLDKGEPLGQASTAAAGMLAANDPENPPQLKSLADLSVSLYPAFLKSIESLSGISVPYQTQITLQGFAATHSFREAPLTPTAVTRLAPQLEPAPHQFAQLAEHSIDPRQLAHSLLSAVRTTNIDIRPNTAVRIVRAKPQFVEILTSTGSLTSIAYIDCTGAWASSLARLSPHAVVPIKGQMLAVALPPTLPLDLVIRTPDVYIVPRTKGPNTGQALVGATIEDRGFDKIVNPADIAALHANAVRLLPQLARAPIIESWAGLRPATTDGLPLLGQLPRHPNHYLATGHYRNGILLAPATAKVMAQLLCKEKPSMNLTPFSPSRILFNRVRRAPIAH